MILFSKISTRPAFYNCVCFSGYSTKCWSPYISSYIFNKAFIIVQNLLFSLLEQINIKMHLILFACLLFLGYMPSSILLLLFKLVWICGPRHVPSSLYKNT